MRIVDLTKTIVCSTYSCHGIRKSPTLNDISNFDLSYVYEKYFHLLLNIPMAWNIGSVQRYRQRLADKFNPDSIVLPSAAK